MEEAKPLGKKPLDRSVALAISNATFSWQCFNKKSIDKTPKKSYLKS